MKDVYGVERGKCTACDCKAFTCVTSGGVRCEYCDHTPGQHVKIVELGECLSPRCSGGNCMKYMSESRTEYSTCLYCGCEASDHKAAHGQAPSSQIRAEYHATSATPTPSAEQPVGTCIFPGCPYPKHKEGHKTHDFCSRTCARKYQSLQAGMSTGGMSTGGMSTGGMSTGGMSTGGMSTGGMFTGGMSTGGMSTGGMSTGGMPTAGMYTGGMYTGGMSTGGMPTAGMYTGGMYTGGMPTGGTHTSVAVDDLERKVKGLYCAPPIGTPTAYSLATPTSYSSVTPTSCAYATPTPYTSATPTPSTDMPADTCIFPDCPFPKHQEGSKIHDFCSRTCARKYQTLQGTSKMTTTPSTTMTSYASKTYEGGTSMTTTTSIAMASYASKVHEGGRTTSQSGGMSTGSSGSVGTAKPALCQTCKTNPPAKGFKDKGPHSFC